MPPSWSDRLSIFFRDERRSLMLARVLDARGCREGWLQGELFGEFAKEEGFRLNQQSAGAIGVPDVSVGSSMIAEVKIIGADYQPKCITGGAIRPFISRAGRQIGPDDREELLLGAWGLVPDYFRLLDATGLESNAERLLILVADCDSSSYGALADALRSIEFQACNSTFIQLSRGFVRIWDVAAR